MSKGGFGMTADFDIGSLKILAVLSMSWEAAEDICRGRNFCALSYRVSGDASFTSAVSQFEVETGDLVYIPRGVDYISKHGKEHITVIHFLSDTFPDKPFAVKASSQNEFGEDFRELLNAYIEKPVGGEYKMLSLFYGVLWKICARGKEEKYRHGSLGEKCAEKAAKIIRESFRDCDFSIARLCSEMDVSGTYLRRVFAENRGISPSEYIASLRFDYASELLRSEYCSVSRISAMSGFSDPKYFSRFITRRTGMSPTEYRKHLSEESK